MGLGFRVLGELTKSNPFVYIGASTTQQARDYPLERSPACLAFYKPRASGLHLKLNRTLNPKPSTGLSFPRGVSSRISIPKP